MEKYALNLGENGRVLSVCVCIEGQTYENIVDSFPDGDVTDYRYIDGEYIYDPEPKPEPPEPPEPPKPDPDPTGSITYATYDELAAAIQEGVNSYGK